MEKRSFKTIQDRDNWIKWNFHRLLDWQPIYTKHKIMIEYKFSNDILF